VTSKKPMTIEELKAATTVSEEELAELKRAAWKKKIKSQRKSRSFILVPRAWVERLRKTHSVATYRVAHHLLYRHFREKGRSFPLGNGALLEERVDRFAKWRALEELEELGLISINRRPRKSPQILVHKSPI
jgi:hypothetical protein